MAATITSITKSSSRAWTFVWTGTAPFRVYLDSRLILSTDETEYTFEDPSYDTIEPPALEFIDDTDFQAGVLPLTLQFPSVATLQWRGNSGAKSYKVEQFIASVWIEQMNILEDFSGYYQFTSGPLDDNTESQFRVTTIDKLGASGTPVPFTFTLQRVPPTPLLDITYIQATTRINVATRS